MLKFFRKYNKLILAVGGTLLMIVFLIEPALNMFYTDPRDRPVGQIDGEFIEGVHIRVASAELDILRRLDDATAGGSGILPLLVGRHAQDDPLKWVLMLYEAEQLGVSASRAEANEALSMLGITAERVTQVATEYNVPTDLIYNAVRKWLTVERYADLVLGQQGMPPLLRLALMIEANHLVRQVQMNPGAMEAQWLWAQAQVMMGQAVGGQRLSGPLIERMLFEQNALVAGQMLVIDSERYRDEASEPTQEQLERLFEAHRDVFAGESEPHGFGYRWPDRVRLEYLAVTPEQVSGQIDIDLDQANEYFVEHREQFVGVDEDGEPVEPTFREVRQQVIEQMEQEQARELADRIMRRANSLLDQRVRQLSRDGSYRVVPEDYEPLSLEELAAQLSEEYGVEVSVHRHAQEWLTMEEVAELEGIGEAALPADAGSFPAYVASVRELEPDPANPLVAYGLQEHLHSQPVYGPDGSSYLFRVRQAKPNRPAVSLDEVREQVERDAWRKNAYELMLEERDAWVSRAREQGLDELAASEELEVVSFDRTPRRQMGFDGQIRPASLPGIGAHESLIDAMFDVAERVTDQGREPITQADTSERTDGQEVPLRLSLVLFRVDNYYPMTESQFAMRLGSPGAIVQINEALLAGAREDAVLTLEALQRRLDFEAFERADDWEPDEQPVQRDRRPGQI